MDSQRAAGQGEAKAQQNTQPQAPHYGRVGPGVGLGERHRVRARGQGDAEAHSPPYRAPCGRPQAP